MRALLTFFIFMTSTVALAEMWETESYKTVTLTAAEYFDPASNKDILFRFRGTGYHGICETGVKFKEKLILLQDGTRHREYFLQANTEAVGDSGLCKPGEPITLAAYPAEIISKWYRLKANNSVTITLPIDITIETK